MVLKNQLIRLRTPQKHLVQPHCDRKSALFTSAIAIPCFAAYNRLARTCGMKLAWLDRMPTILDEAEHFHFHCTLLNLCNTLNIHVVLAHELWRTEKVTAYVIASRPLLRWGSVGCLKLISAWANSPTGLFQLFVVCISAYILVISFCILCLLIMHSVVFPVHMENKVKDISDISDRLILLI